MSKKRKTITKAKAASVRVKGRGLSTRSGSKRGSRSFGRFVLPMMIFAILSGGVLFMVFSGYQTATASAFFGLRNIDIRGSERTSKEEISRIILASVEKPGVWNADLSEIRTKIEKFPFVKSAAVSRTLPAGIRVNVIERVPAAVVHLSSGNYLVDGEGTLLTVVKSSEKEFPFILKGWDESKTEKAVPDNLARLKVYRKMLDEWKQFDLTTRVKEVNLANSREPVAIVEDSGRAIAVTLAKDNFGKSLKTAIEALTGKGAKVKSVDAGGVYPVINYVEY
jgi:cell division septal protein FtsQ